MQATRAAVLVLVTQGAVACSAGSPAAPGVTAPTVIGYRIVAGDGAPFLATEGDAVRLLAVQTLLDGTSAPLPTEAEVVWSGPPTVQALAAGSMPAVSSLPATGLQSSGFWLLDPPHYSEAELSGVLWVMGEGSAPSPGLPVTATISGVVPGGIATATLPVAAMPAGDIDRGKAIYAANCADCHGASGHGTSDFPGLNGEDGHVAGDPAWSAALLAMTARSDMDNAGVSLSASMPRWLTRISANGKTLTTQDFADTYAFLKTQTH
jgi:mono/diheme cytochrome c family protein